MRRSWVLGVAVAGDPPVNWKNFRKRFAPPALSSKQSCVRLDWFSSSCATKGTSIDGLAPVSLSFSRNRSRVKKEPSGS